MLPVFSAFSTLKGACLRFVKFHIRAVRPVKRRIIEVFCQNASVANLTEERRFRLLADRSNLHQLFEDTDFMACFNRRVQTGKWTGLLLLVDQRRVKACLQR